jgi:hypothetical protein
VTSHESPPTICAQSTITVPASIAGKARQKHAWKSPKWRKSYARRTAVERSFAYTKSKATVDLTRGNVRLMGTTKNLFMHAISWAVVNNAPAHTPGAEIPRPAARLVTIMCASGHKVDTDARPHVPTLTLVTERRFGSRR